MTITTKSLSFAPHMRRLGAAVIDGLILTLIGIGISRSLGVNPFVTGEKTAINHIDSLLTLTVSLMYSIGFWVKRNGQTPGKQIMHIKIVQENGKPLDWFTACIRYISQLVSYIVLGLGYIWILFDSKHQSWHDKIAHTLVIESDEKKPHGCITALGCFIPLLFFLGMIGFGVYQGFTQATEKRKTTQSGASINKAITSMKPETKKLYDASQDLFKQMRESNTDPVKVKQLNDENIATIKKAIELEPENAQLWVNLGSAYTWLSSTGTLQDGLKAYAKAEDLDPNNAIYIANTADMLWRLGKYDDAILEVQKALRISDNYAFAHLILARSYYGNKLYANSNEQYQKAIEIYTKINTTGQYDSDILQAQKEQAALPKN